MNYKKQFLMTVLAIFVFLAGLVTYNLVTHYTTSAAFVRQLGESSLAYESEKIEGYLNKSRDIVCITADTVDHMLRNGSDNQAILDYLTDQSKKQSLNFDENFTGIYGWINGEYLDGVGWVPPEDYVATKRDWYVAGLEGQGEPVIVQPYMDAQTHTVMISVAQLLSDGKSVVSFDIALNEIQSITEDIKLGGVGYGFIMDDDGLIIAHFDIDEKGKVYPTDNEQVDLVETLKSTPSGNFKTTLSGEKCTVFTNTVLNDWHVVMVVSDTRLFADIRTSLIVQAAVSVVVFIIILVFMFIAYKRILHYRDKNEENNKKLEKLNDNVIKALAFTIDAKDRYTSGHSQRVANYSLELARRLGKSEEEQRLIYYAGLLHDVGKIRVPEEVLNKPGRLSDSEFDQIKIHTISGYHILKDIYEEPHIALGAKYHHERYNGKGYPDGLSGNNIPEVARIIGVADAYDAMASNRSYRDALPQDVVRREIEKGRGEQFDPVVADVMLNMIDEDTDYTMKQVDSAQKNILMIDDEFLNIKIVENILKDEPVYNLIGAEAFEDGMTILQGEKIDLVLLDLMMPDIDGFDAFKKIKEVYPDVPIVFMTADKSIEAIGKAGELGADDYITKPFLPLALKERIHGIIYSL